MCFFKNKIIFSRFIYFFALVFFVNINKGNCEEIKTGYYGAEELAKKAGEFLREKEYLKAIELTTKALELYPMHALSYLHRGQANYELGNIQEAIVDLKKAIEIHKTFPEAYTSLGIIYYGMGKYEEADSFYSLANLYYPKALEVDSNKLQNVADLCGWAYSLLKLRRTNDAENRLLIAIELDSTYSYAYYLLAGIYLSKNESDIALNYLKKAANHGLQDDWLFEMEGDLNRQECNLNLAGSLYLESIKNKRNARVIYKFIDIYKAKGYFKEISSIRKLIDLKDNKNLKMFLKEPGQILDLLRIASVLNYNNDIINKIYDKGLETGLDTTMIKFELFKMNSYYKDAEKYSTIKTITDTSILSDLMKGIAIKTYDFNITLIEALVGLNKHDEAKVLIEETKKNYLIPSYEKTLLTAMLGYNEFKRYNEKGDKMFLDESEKYFKEALKNCPERIDLQHNLAVIKYKKGQFKDAEKISFSIIEKNQEYFPSMLCLSDIYTALADSGELKNYLKANYYLKKAMDEAYDFQIGEYLLSKIYYQMGYNSFKYLGSYGYKEFKPWIAISGYNYFKKSWEIKKDPDVEYLLTTGLKEIKTDYLKDVCISYSFIIMSIVMLVIAIRRSWKNKTLLGKENLRYWSSFLVLAFIGLYWGQIIEIRGVKIDRKNISEIIYVEMTGVKRVDIANIER